MNERYKRFTPHEDNVQEIISADHVNVIQDQTEKSQQELFRQADEDFSNRALFTLENHPVINSMTMDLLSSPDKVDLPLSPGLAFSTEERGIVFDSTGPVQATLIVKPYTNVNNTNIKQIVFMVDEFLPGGSRIQYELSNNGFDFYSVIPNSSQVFEFPTTGNVLHIKATFFRSVGGASPMLKAYATLYRDPKYVVQLFETLPGGSTETLTMSHQNLVDVRPDDHHPQMHAHNGLDGSGLVSHKDLIDVGEDDHHAKDHRHGQDGVEPVHLEADVVGTLGMEHLSYILQTGMPGDLQLIRNPDAHDKLVQVLSPDTETYLFYDWANDGRLEKTITIFGDVAAEETMTYNTYTNSAGITEIVMLGTTKYIKDATDTGIQDAIATVMAPAP